MGKLNVQNLRYLEGEAFRVLTSIELGTRNHEIVPVELIATLSHLRKNHCLNILFELVKLKLVAYASSQYEGYKLTYPGYDCLALKAFVNRRIIYSIGSQIGLGKESDIYLAATEDDKIYAIKFQRLGRISFRSVKKNRDYLKNRKTSCWCYLSRLAATKEFAFMNILYKYGFPVPQPIDHNRHCIIMEFIEGLPLNRVRALGDVSQVYHHLMDLIVKLANHGLIHGDFNEFNLLMGEEDNITMIDFPQMISIEHPNAEWYFDRDVECVCDFFKRRFCYEDERVPKFSSVVRIAYLDSEVAASGCTKKKEKLHEQLIYLQEDNDCSSEEDGQFEKEISTCHVHLDKLSLQSTDNTVPDESISIFSSTDWKNTEKCSLRKKLKDKEVNSRDIKKFVSEKLEKKHKATVKVHTNAQKEKNKNRSKNKRIIKETSGWD